MKQMVRKLVWTILINIHETLSEATKTLEVSLSLKDEARVSITLSSATEVHATRHATV